MSNPMTLLEAFRTFAPLTGDRAIDSQRDEAARVVRDQLKTTVSAYCGRLRDADCDDIAATIAYRLLRSGPRGAREGDPVNDQQVIAYFRKCAKNALADLLHQQAIVTGEENGKPVFEPIVVSVDSGIIGSWGMLQGASGPSQDPSLSPEDELDRGRARQLLEEAHGLLFDSIAPDLARRRRIGGEVLLESLRELDQIATGELTVKARATSLCQERGEEPTRANLFKARNALHQRYFRALKEVGQEVELRLANHQIDSAMTEALRETLNGLRLRPPGPDEAGGDEPGDDDQGTQA